MFITQCCDHRCGHHKHVLVVTVIAAVIYVAFAAALTLAFATVLAVSLAVVDVLAFGIVLVGCCWCHVVVVAALTVVLELSWRKIRFGPNWDEYERKRISGRTSLKDRKRTDVRKCTSNVRNHF